MIKGRLIRLLSHSKKYIGLNILWQWISLLAQIAVVFSAAELLRQAVSRELNGRAAAMILAVLIVCAVIRFRCERLGARASYLACADVKKILRETIYEKLPKTAHMRKMPIVKAKVGPQITTLMCDKTIYDALVVKKTVKVELAGIYISRIVGLNLEDKKKKTFGQKVSLWLRKQQDKQRS